MPARRCYVLDTYAVMAFLDAEAGGLRVREVISLASKHTVRVIMSEINLGEVLYITEREKGTITAHGTLGILEQMPIEFVPATRPRVLAAARLKAQHPMSYADCFAAGLAIEYDACVLTGDSEFKTVQSEIALEWLD